VDDILVWAPSLPELKTRVETIANNCKNLNITLSKKKFEIGKQIQFAGYLVGENGVKPDPDRIRAIKDFPQPTNLTGVSSPTPQQPSDNSSERRRPSNGSRSTAKSSHN